MNLVSSAAAAALLALAGSACSPAQRSETVPADVIAARAFPEADSLAVQRLARGVSHARIWLRQGPWALHVVEIDTARCAPLWEVRKPQGLLEARALTSALAGTALATLNADFFQIPGGTPVGAQVTAGVPLIGPGDRAAWLWDGRAMFAGRARLHGAILAGTDSIALAQVNRAAARTTAYAPPGTGAMLFTPRAGRITPAADADVVWIQLAEGDERAGSGSITRIDRAVGDTLRIEPGTVAIQLLADARAWGGRRSVGERVRWHAAVRPAAAGAGGDAREAVGGFPLLLRNGTDVQAETELRGAFATQRHPRSAIGWSSASGRVFLVLVDGRQKPYSDGMSLPEMTWLFRRLGATDALNLDGGGSSALVLRGAVVNRPSDTQGERAVGNALALAGCR